MSGMDERQHAGATTRALSLDDLGTHTVARLRL